MSEAPESVILERLFEEHGLPRYDLPAEVEAMYGGPFGLPPRCVYANFVSSVDGVVALDDVRRSSAAISGEEAARETFRVDHPGHDPISHPDGQRRDRGSSARSLSLAPPIA